MRLAKTALLLLVFLGLTFAFAAEPQISAGRYHNLAVTSSGDVYWWGTDFALIRLRKDRTPRSPTLVAGLAHIRTVAAGWEHSIAIDEDGAVYEWGFSPYRSNLVPQLILSPCLIQSLAQLGHGRDPCADQEVARATPIWTDKPVRVPGVPPASLAVAMDSTSVVLTRDGAVYCWSRNSLPRKIPGLERIIDVRLGQGHGVALSEDGTVLTWGSSADGALGRPDADSRSGSICRDFNVKAAFNGAIGIAAGVTNSYAFRPDGSVWGWGNNWSGQLGIRTKPGDIEPSVYEPRRITSIPGIVHLEAGAWSVIARTSSGQLYIWGGNLGNMSARGSLTPIRIDSLEKVVSISMTYDHAVTLMPNGFLCTWGFNEYGQTRPDMRSAGIPQPLPVLMADGTNPLNLAAETSSRVSEACTVWRE